MKKQTVFEANDGTRFDDESKCLSYEEVCSKVDAILVPLPNKKIDSKEFYQHSADIRGIWESLCELFKSENPNFVSHYRTYGDTRTNIIALAMSESSRCWEKAQWKMATIDFATGREYEQPYFTRHPEEATTQIY